MSTRTLDLLVMLFLHIVYMLLFFWYGRMTITSQSRRSAEAVRAPTIRAPCRGLLGIVSYTHCPLLTYDQPHKKITIKTTLSTPRGGG